MCYHIKLVKTNSPRGKVFVIGVPHPIRDTTEGFKLVIVPLVIALRARLISIQIYTEYWGSHCRSSKCYGNVKPKQFYYNIVVLYLRNAAINISM